MQPSLLIDEVDLFLKDNDDVHALLNAGHSRGGQVIRTVGDDFEPRAFSVWCPIVIAGIGRLRDTLEDRAITISLRRRRREEKIDRLRNQTGHLNEYAQRIARWANDNRDALGKADPPLPDVLGDREQDNWRPLIAIADLVGCGEKARTAAKVISTDTAADDEFAAILALADVAATFEVQNVERLSGQELVNALTGMEDRPWSEWKHGKEMTKTSSGEAAQTIRVAATTAMGPVIKLKSTRPSDEYKRLRAQTSAWRQRSAMSKVRISSPGATVRRPRKNIRSARLGRQAGSTSVPVLVSSNILLLRWRNPFDAWPRALQSARGARKLIIKDKSLFQSARWLPRSSTLKRIFLQRKQVNSTSAL